MARSDFSRVSLRRRGPMRPLNTYAPDRRTSFAALLSMPQLDASVHRLEADSWTARLANVASEGASGSTRPRDRHLEICVQRAIDRLQVNIRAEVATELNDDVSR